MDQFGGEGEQNKKWKGKVRGERGEETRIGETKNKQKQGEKKNGKEEEKRRK